MKNNKSQNIDIKKPYVLLATWFGCGLAPKAPGTWGSLGAIPPGLALLVWGNLAALLGGIMIVTALGFWASGEFDKAMGSHDSKMIVIDEVAGQWIAFVPLAFLPGLNAFLVLLAFLLFRLFDITKPWPISHFDQKVEGSLGVMGDDIIAGIFTAICLQGVIYAGFG